MKYSISIQFISLLTKKLPYAKSPFDLYLNNTNLGYYRDTLTRKLCEWWEAFVLRIVVNYTASIQDNFTRHQYNIIFQ